MRFACVLTQRAAVLCMFGIEFSSCASKRKSPMLALRTTAGAIVSRVQKNMSVKTWQTKQPLLFSLVPALRPRPEEKAAEEERE